MEVNEDGFLKELLSLGTETNSFFTNNWEFETFNAILAPPLPNLPSSFDCSFNELCAPFDLIFTPPNLVDDYKKIETPSFRNQEENSMPVAKEGKTDLQVDNKEEKKKKKKKSKLEGQPSKNLMAERRRRKRLNDRLSMLRSVVPKISKMDRTSIVGDAIDYMKELLERIHNLQEEIDANSGELSIFKGLKPNDVLARTSPQFDVERRNADTRIEIRCMGKPGMLQSTMTTLETSGLEIQQCVISCFDDFSLYASCSEELKQRTPVSSEEIKQALFRNAGYGGRC